MTVGRRIVRAGGLHWQLREAGDAAAPLLVLLHPSPRSGAMYEGWLPALAGAFHVVAPDTPGYGGSDPLPATPATLADYVPPLQALLQALRDECGAGPALVYGSATGAQLALALALAQPRAVAHLVLDNAAHFDDEERARILERYFPDLTPRADGSHLAAAWQMCAQMPVFFPWFAADEAHRIAAGPAPPAAVHEAVRELLAAGAGYAAAYRAAFQHERAEHVQALAVPTTLLRWQGSPLLRHIDRLLAHPLPACVQVLDVPAPLPQRQAVMTAHLRMLRGLHGPCERVAA
jgi:pimeloyl-ACP methyl ester carboxylesterase